MMKSGLKLVAILALLIGATTASHAQRDYRALKHEHKTLQLATTFSGELTGWENNEDFVYCGFYLQTSGEKYLVKFSPNTGSELAAQLRTGNKITVNAIKEIDSLDRTTLLLVSVTSDGKNIYNRPFRNSSQVPAEDFIFGSSKIIQLQKTAEGNVNGLILSDETILRIPASIADQIYKIADVGDFVSYSGYQILRYGQFANVKYTIVHCISITIKEKQYVII